MDFFGLDDADVVRVVIYGEKTHFRPHHYAVIDGNGTNRHNSKPVRLPAEWIYTLPLLDATLID